MVSNEESSTNISGIRKREHNEESDSKFIEIDETFDSSKWDKNIKTGRPVEDRKVTDSELVQIFKVKLLDGIQMMNEKLKLEPTRTDKYWTMLVRLCKWILSEAMGMLGIDSYSKSNAVDKFLPEYLKRFDQMKKIIEELALSSNSNDS